jgi:hypothetical protein
MPPPLIPRLYDDLVPWYDLVDPVADHALDAAMFIATFERLVSPRPTSLLELGAGAGLNARHLSARFACVLTDLSPAMQARSQILNPGCEHALGDMRTLRLFRTFDCVLVHDAIAYMASRADLAAALTTAFVHLRAGGAALFAPDSVRDRFREDCELLEADAPDGRSLRAAMWTWDPDRDDETCVADFAFLLREGGHVRAVHDHHLEGLFDEATWLELIAGAGFVDVERVPRDVGDTSYYDHVFVGRRP